MTSLLIQTIKKILTFISVREILQLLRSTVVFCDRPSTPQALSLARTALCAAALQFASAFRGDRGWIWSSSSTSGCCLNTVLEIVSCGLCRTNLFSFSDGNSNLNRVSPFKPSLVPPLCSLGCARGPVGSGRSCRVDAVGAAGWCLHCGSPSGIWAVLVGWDLARGFIAGVLCWLNSRASDGTPKQPLCNLLWWLFLS